MVARATPRAARWSGACCPRGATLCRVSGIVSFVPGPAHVREEVLRAMAVAPAPHRGPQIRALVGRVQAQLRTLLGTEAPVFPVLASGTAALEAALCALGRQRALVVVTGAFGARLAKVAAATGLEVETLTVPPGRVAAPDAVAHALDAAPFDVVAVVHNETQTGALADVVAIAREVAARPGVALVVDAVSSFAGVELRLDDLAPETVLVSVTGKALACPPGVSIVAVSEAAAERARGAVRGGYALRLESLVASARREETPQTPSIPLLHALGAQLPRILDEGLAARAARHGELATTVRAWAERRFAVLAEPECRSPTVTTVENTTGLDVATLLAAVERRGFRIANGYAELRGATFRIGHMGDVTREETDGLLAALDAALDEIG